MAYSQKQETRREPHIGKGLVLDVFEREMKREVKQKDDKFSLTP